LTKIKNEVVLHPSTVVMEQQLFFPPCWGVFCRNRWIMGYHLLTSALRECG
jgi:hypothetical protein